MDSWRIAWDLIYQKMLWFQLFIFCFVDDMVLENFINKSLASLNIAKAKGTVGKFKQSELYVETVFYGCPLQWLESGCRLSLKVSN